MRTILPLSGKRILTAFALTMLFLISFSFSLNAQPANDNCAGATVITVGTSCSYTTYTNASATPSPVAAPSCGSFAGTGQDVWFKVTVPTSGHLVFNTSAGVVTDGVMAIYSGACGSLSEIACDDNSGSGNMPYINRGGLSAGSTIYIRFWAKYATVSGTFGLCVYDNPIASDFCSSAPMICNVDGYQGNTSSSYTSDCNSGCSYFSNMCQMCGNFGGSIENNSWITFVASATSATLQFNVSNCTYSDGIQYGIYSGYYTGTDCDGFALLTDYNQTTDPMYGVNSITANGLTIGNTYFIMVDGFAGDVCDYQINVIGGVATGTISQGGGGSTVCSGQTGVTYTINTSATGYVWTVPPGATITSGQGTNTITVDWGTATSGNVECTTTAGACSGIYRTLFVTVTPSPVASAGNNGPVCVGDPLGLGSSPSGMTSYNWSGPNGFSSTQEDPVISASATLAMAGTYTVTVTNGACSSTDNTTVVVSPIATANAGVDQTICAGSTVTLAGSFGGAAVSASWSGGGGSYAPDANTMNAVYTPSAAEVLAGTVTLTLTTNDPGCGAATDNMTITINPVAVAPTSANVDNASFCAGDFPTITLTAVGGSGTTLNWYTGSCGGALVGTGTPLTIASPASTTTYYAAWSTPCGLSACQSVTVTIASTATPPTSANVDVNNFCESSIPNITLTAVGGSGTTLNWYSSSCGGTFVGSGTPLVIPAPTTTTTYYAGWADACGTSSCQSVTVTVNPLPVAPTSATADNTTFCVGDFANISLSASGGTGTTLNWYDDACGGNLIGTGTPLLISAPASTTTYYAAWTNACGTSTCATTTVTVSPLPTQYNLTGGGAYCTGGAGVSYNLSGSEVGVDYELYLNGSPSGTVVPGTGAPLNGTLTAAGTYTIVATNSSTACENNMNGSVVVSIDPLPTQYNVTGGGTYCSGGTGMPVYLDNSSVGTNYQLLVDGIPVGAPVAGTGLLIDFGNQTTAGTYTVQATTVATSCQNTMNGSVVININPLPTVFNVSGGGDYCNGGAGVSISLSGSEVGVDYEIFINGIATGNVISGTGGVLSGTATAAGTYTFEAVNTSTSCQESMNGSAVVNVFPEATVNAGPDDVMCTGSKIQLAGSFGGSATSATWSGGTGSYAPDANTMNAFYTPSAAENAAGTFTLTLTTDDPAGPCTAVFDDVTITIETQAISDAGPDQTICADETVTLAGSFSGSASSASWSGGTGSYNPDANTLTAVYTPSAAEIAAGTVTLTLTTDDPAGPCAAMPDDVIITINPLPTAYNVTGGGSYCSGGTGVPVCLDGSDVGVDYQLQLGGVDTGVPVAGTGSPICFPDQTAAGNYTVVATNAALCSNTMTGTANVTVFANPIADAGPDVSIPNGTSTTLNGSASGGSGSYSYNWSPAGSLVNATIQNPTTTNLSSTTVYTVTVTDLVTGCTGTDQVTVTVTGGPLTVSTTATPATICAGASSQLNALASGGSGAYTYSWSSSPAGFSSSISNPLVTPVVTTTYTVTVDDGFNTATSSVAVTVNPLPTAYNVTGGGAYCSGGSGNTICLSGSEVGVNYQLQLGGVNTGAPIAGTGSSFCFPSQTAAGTYTVIATNGTTSCTNNMAGSAIITIDPNPTANAGSDVTIPNGTSTTLNGSASGGSGSYSYSWSPAGSLVNAAIQNPTTVNLSSTTTYTLTVTDLVSGCSGTDQVVVTITGAPLSASATATPSAICLGSSSQLQANAAGGSGSYTYSWTSVPAGFTSTQSNPSVNPTVTTTYTVVVNDGFNTASSSVIVTVNANPTANAGSDATICNGTTTTLNASGGVSYSWSPATGLSSTSIQNPIAAPTINMTYVVTVTDNNGCTASDNVNVSIISVIPANAGVDQSICTGEQAFLNASGGVSFNWAPSGSLSSSVIANPIAIPSNTTTYTVTTTDANGCTSSDNIIVTVNMGVTADAGVNVSICSGSSAILAGTGGSIFTWSPSTGLSDPNIANPIASPLNTTTYTVTVSNGNGCQGTDNVTVTVNSSPALSAGSDVAVCSGSSANLGASGALIYSWSPNVALSSTSIANPVASPLVTTTYIVTGTGANGCTSTDDITVTVNQTPTADAGPPVTICNHEYTTLVASGGTGYLWNNGTSSASNIVGPSANTVYTVTVTNTDGCTASDNVAVTVKPYTSPVITANGPITFCDSDPVNVTLSANAGYSSYLWSNGATSQAINVTSPGTYYCQGTSANGCSDTSNFITVASYLGPIDPVIIADGPADFCEKDTISVNLSTTTSYYLYHWTSGSNTPTIHVTHAGEYWVTVTDANGCSAVSAVPFVINYIPYPVAYMNYSASGMYLSFYNYSLNDDSYLWDFGDGTTSTLENPTHTYTTPGTYQVIFTVTNECGTDVEVVTIVVESGLGISENDLIENLLIFPIPTKDLLYISFETNEGKEIDLSILNTLGQEVYYESLGTISGKFHKEMNLEQFSTGIYYLRIKSKDGILNNKIVVN